MRRMLFEKTGTAIWMSHLDTMRLMQRAFRRAGVVLHHSQGYTPHAYVSMLLPLSVGTESVCEIMEYELDAEIAITPEDMNAVLPQGVRVLRVYESDRKAKYLTELAVSLTMLYDHGVPDGAAGRISALLNSGGLYVEKRTKRGMEETDIRPMIHQTELSNEDDKIILTARISAQNPSLNPALLTAAIERYLPQDKPDFVRYRRLEVYDENGEVFR
ncbi:MAG: DUF2344 domain-containing protein [Oscillospiraceae bacterium]|nr:DUF2344 domain-containing protein [Oscillospiraceae bacterium]